MTPEDYRRWRDQKRHDILQYIPRPEVYANLGDNWVDWMDPLTGEVLQHCPFLKRIGRGKYFCLIYDTKPRVCKEFWCEWSYRAGKKGVPFKGAGGWTKKAKELGYDDPVMKD
jgi:Fe-S-cluster containining protein